MKLELDDLLIRFRAARNTGVGISEELLDRTEKRPMPAARNITVTPVAPVTTLSEELRPSSALRIIAGTAAGLRGATFYVTEVTGNPPQLVCWVGRIRISLTLTRCGWPTA